MGVLRATVKAIGATRSFRRRNGGDGLVCRVTLRDPTGEVDLVLWDNETRQAAAWGRGQPLVLRGPAVKAGRDGAVELGLAGCILEVPALPTPARTRLAGRLLDLGPTQVVGTGPEARFKAEARIEAPGGPLHLVAWDSALRAVRGVLPGGPLVVEGAVEHPELPGWFLADSSSRITRS